MTSGSAVHNQLPLRNQRIARISVVPRECHCPFTLLDETAGTSAVNCIAEAKIIISVKDQSARTRQTDRATANRASASAITNLDPPSADRGQTRVAIRRSQRCRASCLMKNSPCATD